MSNRFIRDFVDDIYRLDEDELVNEDDLWQLYNRISDAYDKHGIDSDDSGYYEWLMDYMMTMINNCHLYSDSELLRHNRAAQEHLEDES